MSIILTIFFLLIGYILPVAVIAQEFGLVAGVFALILPLALHYTKDRDTLKLVFWIGWMIVALIAMIMAALNIFIVATILAWILYLLIEGYIIKL